MRHLTPGAVGALLFSVFAASPAAADDSNFMKFDVAPGESQTVYLTNDKPAGLPVFKVCFQSLTGYAAALRVTEANKGPASGQTEAMRSGDCLFASGERLVVSVEAELSAERVKALEAAGRQARAWMTERIEALRALPDPTDQDTALLAEFEARLTADSLPVDDLEAMRRLQYLERSADLERQADLTDQEKIELTWSKYQTRVGRPETNSFKVWLLSH